MSSSAQDESAPESDRANDGYQNLRVLLDSAEAVTPAEGVDAMAALLVDTVSATEVTLLIADISGLAPARLAPTPAPSHLRPLTPARERVLIAGTSAGCASHTHRVRVNGDPDGFWVHVPVTERGDALGALELLLARSPNESVVDYLASAGHALAHVIIADRRFSDL
jgi:hypothetical protein